jgi:pyrroloquinoline quinone (PQQ) biosynthesis protein C
MKEHSSLKSVLKGQESRLRLIRHPFFTGPCRAPLAREVVALLLGQWWHPLHYFPVFLARVISVTPSLQAKTAVSKILFQELGCGNVEYAHEEIFIKTMFSAGFTEHEIAKAPPLHTTTELILQYEKSSSNELSALGAVYGTEVCDLAMVSAIGNAVRNTTGVTSLPWVEIHMEQEPEHVAKAEDSLHTPYTIEQQKEIIQGADLLWRHWIALFDEVMRYQETVVLTE